MLSNSSYKQIISLSALATVFLIVSYFAQMYHVELSNIIERGGIFGIVGFILLTAIFVIFIIPLDTVFLIPIGISVFGTIPNAFMSIIGWTIGSAVAFSIARSFGTGIVKRLSVFGA